MIQRVWDKLGGYIVMYFMFHLASFVLVRLIRRIRGGWCKSATK